MCVVNSFLYNLSDFLSAGTLKYAYELLHFKKVTLMHIHLYRIALISLHTWGKGEEKSKVLSSL